MCNEICSCLLYLILQYKLKIIGVAVYYQHAYSVKYVFNRYTTNSTNYNQLPMLCLLQYNNSYINCIISKYVVGIK